LSNGAVSQTSQASEEAETATRTGSRTTDPDKEEARVSSQGLRALDAYFNKLHPPEAREGLSSFSSYLTFWQSICFP
jgi:hypothetical protein